MPYFDCVILTPSRNRIKSLTTQIATLAGAAEMAGITVCHLIFEDCSDEGYDYAGKLQELNEKYSPRYQIVHHPMKERHGRLYFSTLFTKMFQAAQKYKFKYALIAVDDSTPCKNFFNRAITHFEYRRYEDISVVGMNTGWNGPTKMWGFVRYMDCGMLCVRKFFQELNWKSPKVSSHWLRDPLRSSGVGFIISHFFNKSSEYSLAANDGHSFMSATGSGGPSQMFEGAPTKGLSTPARETMFVDSPGHVYNVVINGKPIIEIEEPEPEPEPEPIPKKEIELTVIMPMFRAKYIGWLPLESLVVQKGIDFKWELLIAEEVKDEPFGVEAIMKYKQRLEAVGCTNLKYIGLQEWIPLAKKWIMLAHMAAETSEVLCGHPADYYASPSKLARHMKVFSDPAVVWHQPRRAIHYLIKTGDMILQNATNNKRKDNVIGKAMRPKFLRGFPADVDRRTGIDGWMFKGYRKAVIAAKVPFTTFPELESDDWKNGISTIGFNNISPKGRLPRVGKGLIFTEYREDVRQYIPPFIIDKLEASREFLPKHARSLPQNRKEN